ncbi:MAG: flagellar basal body L-ring protein FlgH [Deltaproteobacteria bacterium]|nr:flagellar basal body L-ring protein FlgH [Deltaproteobacteria bacterium]
MSRVGVLVLIAFATAGCSTHVAVPPWPEPTPIAPAPPAVRAPVQSTSLWADGAPLTGAYNDNRARRVGDVVTVLVVESSAASREASTDLSRGSSVDASVSAMLGAPMTFGLDHLYGSGGFDPSVKAGTKNSFKGQGTTTRKDQLRSTVAARVVNVLDDGNLVVEGRRQVTVNEENQFLFVRGIARPSDISPENSITSIALADAQILYGGRGDLADQQKPGWLGRIVSAVWPF